MGDEDMKKYAAVCVCTHLHCTPITWQRKLLPTTPSACLDLPRSSPTWAHHVWGIHRLEGDANPRDELRADGRGGGTGDQWIFC